jgi:hypothetical protein
MAGIPANAYPLSLLDKLGIKVKASNQGDVALPAQLGDYLDRVIKGGDLDELNQLVPGINTAVVQLGKSNPTVLLKALLASLESSEAFMQTGSETVNPESSTDFRHLSNLADYHARAIETVATIAAEAGLSNEGLHFEIADQSKFEDFIERLLSLDGFVLDERSQSLFNDIMVDVVDKPLSLDDKIPLPELRRRAKYLEILSKIGLSELKNEYMETTVNSDELSSALRRVIVNYDSDTEYARSVREFEDIVAPLHALE